MTITKRKNEIKPREKALKRDNLISDELQRAERESTKEHASEARTGEVERGSDQVRALHLRGRCR